MTDSSGGHINAVLIIEIKMMLSNSMPTATEDRTWQE